MAKYLVRQRRDGTPIGIHSSGAYYYLPDGKRFQADGVASVMSKSKDDTWDEFVMDKSYKSPDHNGKWMQFDSNADSLPEALQEARAAVGH